MISELTYYWLPALECLAMKPRLLVLSGVRAGEVFPLTEDAFSIGRDEEAGCCIDDPWVSFQSRQQCPSLHRTVSE